MGIPLEVFRLMARAAQDGPRGGSLLTLGKQDVEFTLDTALLVAAEFGFVQRQEGGVAVPQDHPIIALIREDKALSARPEYRARNCVSDVAALSLLGFSVVHSVDYSKFEGADFEYDLNQPGLVQMLGRTYDYVYDGGTLEHVYHLPNSLANLSDTVSVGGLVIHDSPANNYCDHGFYQFSPTLYYDYYEANGFEVVRAGLARFTKETAYTGPWDFIPYTPGSLEATQFGGLDGRIFNLHFVARKTAQSTSGKIPHQYRYRSYEQKVPVAAQPGGLRMSSMQIGG